MFKSYPAIKDAYITDKIVKSVRKTSANVGDAATIDLFKLYGVATSGSTPLVETSRGLIQFDLTGLKSLHSSGTIDITNDSFWCKLHLRDVYGGQPTPDNFTVSVFPLSASFTEGRGRDNVYFSDVDACNWLSSSKGTTWYVSGCHGACHAQSTPGDYITSSLSLSSTEIQQTFSTGEEDLLINVTSLVSATLTGEIPDRGFRLSFMSDHESDNQTYFVKRFGSRTVYDPLKRPRLIFGYDDAVTDDTQNLTFDEDNNLFFYNYVGGSPKNLKSGSYAITGTNCIVLKLSTEVSGGWHSLTFSGSQFSPGVSPLTGTYRAVVNVPTSDAIVSSKLAQSGSVKFFPIWSSTDGTLTYLTGSVLTFNSSSRGTAKSNKTFEVSVLGTPETMAVDAVMTLRVNIFDRSSPMIKFSKIPVEIPGVVVRDVFYSVRDVASGAVVIPFDEAHGSTRVSSDAAGMFFALDASSLTVGRSYVIDIMIVSGGDRKRYNNASSVFRVVSTDGA